MASPSLYLQRADYELYGISPDQTPASVVRASTLIDAFTHRPEGLISSDGATMDATGKAIVEQLNVPFGRTVVLSRTPIVTLVKTESTAAGQPWSWRETPVGAFGYLDEGTGKFELPAQVSYPGRVRVTYVAGWSYDQLPAAIKLAAATIVRRISTDNDLGPNVKRASAGDASIERFSAQFLDDEVARLLTPFVRVVPV